jgi:hypothetical protein
VWEGVNPKLEWAPNGLCRIQGYQPLTSRSRRLSVKSGRLHMNMKMSSNPSETWLQELSIEYSYAPNNIRSQKLWTKQSVVLLSALLKTWWSQCLSGSAPPALLKTKWVTTFEWEQLSSPNAELVTILGCCGCFPLFCMFHVPKNNAFITIIK